MAVVLLYLGLAAVAWYVATAVMAWYPLRKFPGPFVGKFSYGWVAWASQTGRAVQDYADQCEAHPPGTLVRVAPDMLLTNDPAAVRHMSSARKAYPRSDWYMAFRLDYREHSMFSTQDPAYHDDVRQKTSAGYSGRDVPGLEADCNEVMSRLRNLIREKYLVKKGKPAKPMNFAHMAHWLTLDTLGKIAFGLEFGHMEADDDIYQIASTTWDTAPFIQFCADIPFIRRLVFSEFMIKHVGPKPTDPVGLGKLNGLAREVVSKRYTKDAEQHNDMLGSFIRHGLTQTQSENEAMLQFIAGSDTISTVMRATMLQLMTHVTVYRRLQSEIDAGVATGAISAPITLAEAKRMPYLQAVILESMRIHPAASSLFLKVVPPGGDEINGVFVPGGTHVGSSLWSLLRRKDVFGEDALVFRPERWLDPALDPAKRSEMAQTVDLNFGYGKWSCAGKQIGIMELNKIFVELLRYFDFELVDPANPWVARSHNLFYVKEMMVTVSEREFS